MITLANLVIKIHAKLKVVLTIEALTVLFIFRTCVVGIMNFVVSPIRLL